MYPAQILVIVYSDKETYLGPPSSCLKLMMSGFPIFCTLFFLGRMDGLMGEFLEKTDLKQQTWGRLERYERWWYIQDLPAKVRIHLSTMWGYVDQRQIGYWPCLTHTQEQIEEQMDDDKMIHMGSV